MKINKKIIVLLLMITVNLITSGYIAKQNEAAKVIQQKFKIENQKFEKRFAEIAVLNFNEEVDKTQFKKLKAITKDSTKENLKAIGLDNDFVDTLTQEQLDSFKTLSVKLYNQAVANLHSNLDLEPSQTIKQTFKQAAKQAAKQILTSKKQPIIQPIIKFDKEPVREAQKRAIKESMRQLEIIRQEANEKYAADLRAKVATEEFKKLMAPKAATTPKAVTPKPVTTKPPVNNPAATGPRPVRTYNTIKFKPNPVLIQLTK